MVNFDVVRVTRHGLSKHQGEGIDVETQLCINNTIDVGPARDGLLGW
jgi:hypothetical protein